MPKAFILSCDNYQYLPQEDGPLYSDFCIIYIIADESYVPNCLYPWYFLPMLVHSTDPKTKMNFNCFSFYKFSCNMLKNIQLSLSITFLLYFKFLCDIFCFSFIVVQKMLDYGICVLFVSLLLLTTYGIFAVEYYTFLCIFHRSFMFTLKVK